MTSLQKRFIPACVGQARLNDTVGQGTCDPRLKRTQGTRREKIKVCYNCAVFLSTPVYFCPFLSVLDTIPTPEIG